MGGRARHLAVGGHEGIRPYLLETHPVTDCQVIAWLKG